MSIVDNIKRFKSVSNFLLSVQPLQNLSNKVLNDNVEKNSEIKKDYEELVQLLNYIKSDLENVITEVSTLNK